MFLQFLQSSNFIFLEKFFHYVLESPFLIIVVHFTSLFRFASIFNHFAFKIFYYVIITLPSRIPFVTVIFYIKIFLHSHGIKILAYHSLIFVLTSIKRVKITLLHLTKESRFSYSVWSENARVDGWFSDERACNIIAAIRVTEFETD